MATIEEKWAPIIPQAARFLQRFDEEMIKNRRFAHHGFGHFVSDLVLIVKAQSLLIEDMTDEDSFRLQKEHLTIRLNELLRKHGIAFLKFVQELELVTGDLDLDLPE